MNRIAPARALRQIVARGDATRPVEPANRAARTAPYPLRPLLVAGLLSLLGWAGVYILLFSHTLWHAPSLIPDHWPRLFYPIQALFPWSWVHAHHDMPAGWPNIIAWLVLAAGLGAAWGWALRAAARLPAGDGWLEREGGRIVIAGLVLFSALLVFSPGFTSQDPYSNIFYAKMAAVYHVSPYLYGPNSLAYQDPQHWLQWIYWKDQPSVYGPAWVWPAMLLAKLAQAIDGDIVTYLLTQRIGTAVVNIVNAVLIWHLAGRLFPGKPGARLATTLFYAWCPLVIWEFANNAHNDALLIFWALVAIRCHLQGLARAAHGAGPAPAGYGAGNTAAAERFAGLGGWWLAALGALLLAGLTKASGFLLMPAYLMLLYRAVGSAAHPWRQRTIITLATGLLGLALAGLLYQPYWDGLPTLQVLLKAPGNALYLNSLGYVLRFRGPEILHQVATDLSVSGAGWSIGAIGDSMEKWVRNLALGIAGVIGVLLTLRVRDLPSLLKSWAWTLVAYVLIAAMWFWPWYLTWIMPLAALVGPGRLRRTMVLYTLGGMASYGLVPVIPPPITDWEGYMPLVCFGPVALYLAGCVAHDAWDAGRRRGALLRAPLPGTSHRPVPMPAEWVPPVRRAPERSQ